MPSKQETFDTVVSFLIAQGKPAKGRDGCMYRGPDGTKCAAGCLIPDEMYSEDMEGGGIGIRLVNYPKPLPYSWEWRSKMVSSVLANCGHDLELVNDLQYAHDDSTLIGWPRLSTSADTFLDEFKRRAQSVAQRFNLEWKYDAAV